ncbi:MAG: dephospho-CoA kinase [Candidatus Accumulibacter sp.]|jgi:dephospho-CoA kinase|nr:dephospho-CoA kinase [Accumulibacter sp.]
MSYVVGLTGGIGSGKTTVAQLFAGHGAAIVDTDAIAHELTAPGGAAMPAIVRAFGTAIQRADGGLDRPAMRQRCFSDPAERARLEAILHPLIGAEAAARCESEAARRAPYALLAVPLFVETGGHYRRRVARLLVVDCAEALQVARVMARSGLSREEAERIVAAQATRAERLAAADDVLENAGSLEELAAAVAALDRRYTEFAKNAARSAKT